MSSGRPGMYHARTSSMTRQLPAINNAANVGSLTRALQSGSMNVTTTARARPPSGYRQNSMERGNSLIRNIPASSSLVQRRTSNDATRSRMLSNQDRSVGASHEIQSTSI